MGTLRVHGQFDARLVLAPAGHGLRPKRKVSVVGLAFDWEDPFFDPTSEIKISNLDGRVRRLAGLDASEPTTQRLLIDCNSRQLSDNFTGSPILDSRGSGHCDLLPSHAGVGTRSTGPRRYARRSPGATCARNCGSPRTRIDLRTIGGFSNDVWQPQSRDFRRQSQPGFWSIQLRMLLSVSVITISVRGVDAQELPRTVPVGPTRLLELVRPVYCPVLARLRSIGVDSRSKVARRSTLPQHEHCTRRRSIKRSIIGKNMYARIGIGRSNGRTSGSSLSGRDNRGKSIISNVRRIATVGFGTA